MFTSEDPYSEGGGNAVFWPISFNLGVLSICNTSGPTDYMHAYLS